MRKRDEEAPPKKKRPRLPEGAVEFKIRLVRDESGEFQVDPQKLHIRPIISPQVLVEASQALAKWAGAVHTRMRIDSVIGPRITEAVQQSKTEVALAIVGAVFNRLTGGRTSR